jgi:hypothetical protein
MLRSHGIFFNARHRTWGWYLPGVQRSGYTSKFACAQRYVRELVHTQPVYVDVLHGKTWREIFGILGISVDGM